MNENRNIPKLRFPEFTDEWKNVPFGNIVQRKSQTKLSSGNLPSVEYDDVEPEIGKLNKDIYSKEASKKGILFDESDILYGKLRPYLHHWLSPSFKGVATGDWWVLTSSDIDKQFVYSLIQTEQYDSVANQSSGSKMPRSDWKTVSQKYFMIPSDINEQQRIGSFFSKIDSVIALQQQYVDQLKEFKKGCLQNMFPKKGETVPEMRFSGAYNDKGEWVAFTDDWEQRKLGDIADSFEYGLNAAAKKFDGQNKYIRITDIDDETHEFLQTDLTSPDTNLNQANNYKLNEGDVLFARTGASVGKTYIYRRSDGLVYYAGFLIRARISEKYDPEFVFQNTLTPAYDNYIRITSQRSGQPGVNAQEYAEYELMVPSLPEQRKIGNVLRSIDNLITLHQRKLDEMKEFKKGCLQKMFV